jgi:hypothetical protein
LTVLSVPVDDCSAVDTPDPPVGNRPPHPLMSRLVSPRKFGVNANIDILTLVVYIILLISNFICNHKICQKTIVFG